jgi:heme-degrading monooxygenase HmoA
MDMVIRNYRVPAGQMDEVVRRVDELWLDRVRKLPGFVSYYVARPTHDRLTSCSIFLDEEAAKKAAEASAEWVGATFMDLDVETVDWWIGPVVVHGGA